MKKETNCKIYGIMTGGKWDKLHEICCRVYSVDGISPCLTTCGGGNQEVKIAVIEDTKNDRQ